TEETSKGTSSSPGPDRAPSCASPTRFARPSRSSERAMTDIGRVGVLGCGLMGSGIAQVAATAGYETIVRDVSQEIWDRARGGIEKSLAKLVEKGKLAATDRDAALKRLAFTTPRATSRTATSSWRR